MPTKIILGLQHGDEGKGRIVDDLAETWADVVVRFQGGGNAGHTVYDENGRKFVTHILPVGILNKSILNIISKGCVLNVKDLYDEIKEFNVSPSNLKISGLCPLIEPTHILKDRFKYQKKLGTTARGIGPAYSDYYARDSILFRDLVKSPAETLMKIQTKFFDYQTFLAQNGAEGDIINDNFYYFNNWTKEYKEYSGFVSQFINTEENILSRLYSEGKNILLEGAQGSGLSINSENYPDVTSSNPSVGSAINATGLNHNQIDDVIGVIKAYKTKVGSGEFPSIIHDGQEHILSEIGKEYGATTGRPRMCGWLDLDEVKSAVQVNGVNHICLIKSDVMTHIDNPHYYYNKEVIPMTRINKVEKNDKGLMELIEIIKNKTDVNVVSFTTGPLRGQIVWDN